MWRLARLLLCKWGGWGSGKKDDDGKMRNIYNVRAREIFRLWGGGF